MDLQRRRFIRLAASGTALAVLSAAVAAHAWEFAHRGGSALWKDELRLAGSFWLIFLVYPLLLGKRAQRAREPYLAAVVASAV